MDMPFFYYHAMTDMTVTENIMIERPAATVRRQFGDVAHHREHGVHRGVHFEVIDDNSHECRYRQFTKVGPLTLRQELTLARAPSGPLVNTIERGQLAGGSISFAVEPLGPNLSAVTATVASEVSPWRAPAMPFMRWMVGRSLRRALAEDKVDLEGASFDGSRDETEQLVADFFDQFDAAFGSLDGSTIAQRYAQPYVAHRADGTSATFDTDEAIAGYFQGLVDDYSAGGVRSCRHRDVIVVEVGAMHVLATVTWELLDQASTLVTSWRESYLLVRAADGLAICASVDH